MAVVAFTTRANLVANAVENIADVTNCLDKLLVGVNAIESANIVDATVTDTDLASPANAIWRTLQTWDARVLGTSPAGLFATDIAGSMQVSGAQMNGTRQYTASAAASAVAGKTTKYRWSFNYLTNGVAPNTAITLDLRAVTGLTGSTFNTIDNLTLGAAQPGPAVTFTPSVPGLGASASTAVVIADGTYTLGITLAGTPAATSYMLLSVSLQMQHV